METKTNSCNETNTLPPLIERWDGPTSRPTLKLHSRSIMSITGEMKYQTSEVSRISVERSFKFPLKRNPRGEQGRGLRGTP